MTAAGWVVLAALLLAFCATVAAWRGQTRIDEALATLDHDDQFDGPTEQAMAEVLDIVSDCTCASGPVRAIHRPGCPEGDTWWLPQLVSVPLPGDTVPDDSPTKEFVDRLRLVVMDEAAKQRGQW